MIIKKILNNNAVLSSNDKGEDIIILGKGIAFQKKVGESITLTNRTEIFTGSNKDLNEKLLDIVSNIPQEYLHITEKVVEMIEKDYGKQINNIIYVTLTEHIQGAIERFHSGVELKNPFLTEIKRLYSDEYEVSKKTLTLIQNEFGIKFNEDEAGFIAFHIVNAELNGDMENIFKITKIMHEILDVIKYHFKVEFDEDTLQYHRFVTHLKFFAQRIFNQTTHSEEDNELFYILKEKYGESFLCVEKIKTLIEKKYQYALSEEEQLYLMIHIQRIKNKVSKPME
ncbi:MAG: BglG family transcription antiterminator LicT [Turicibacter sp.]